MSEPTSQPIEITMIILGFLHDSPDSSLVPWSLASRMFCHLAREILFKTVEIQSYWCLDTLKDILCTSREILPYIERVYFGHGHSNAPKQPLRHPYLPRFLNLLHEQCTITHFGMGWISPFDPPPAAIMDWKDFTDPAQAALRKLTKSHSIESIHVAHIYGLPANELIDLRAVRVLTLHNVQFDGPSSLDVEGGEKSVSKLTTLRISGNEVLSSLYWLGASIQGMPQLRWLSVSSATTMPRKRHIEFAHPALVTKLVQPLIVYARDSLERLDLNTPFKSLRRGVVEHWNLDLSPLKRMNVLTANIACYGDDNTQSGFPSTTPSLAATLSTLHTSMPVEIRLTIYYVFVSPGSPVAISSLDAIDSALAGKNVKLHIAPTTNRYLVDDIEEALATLFRGLREQDRVCTHTVAKLYNNHRFWDDQWSGCKRHIGVQT